MHSPKMAADIIKWNADHTQGVKTTKHSTFTVLSRREAMRQYIKTAFLRWVEKPDTQSVSPYHTLRLAEPGVAHFFQQRIMDELKQLMPKWVDEWRKQARAIPEEKQSDTEFLGAMTRDYRKGCAVCLTDKIMGTTCGCGHTEIAVFRPCGHAMCVNPCFEQWMKTNQVTFSPQTFIVGDQQLVLPSKRDLSTFPPGRFSCPECRATLRSVFRAEEIRLPAGLPLDDWVVTVTANAGFMFGPDE